MLYAGGGSVTAAAVAAVVLSFEPNSIWNVAFQLHSSGVPLTSSDLAFVVFLRMNAISSNGKMKQRLFLFSRFSWLLDESLAAATAAAAPGPLDAIFRNYFIRLWTLLHLIRNFWR